MTSLLSSEAVETGITPGGTTGAFRDVLSKHHAHRRKPPVHFTDMSDGEREEALKELGYPKFRASQLARHYFSHYTTDVTGYSDFPTTVNRTDPIIPSTVLLGEMRSDNLCLPSTAPKRSPPVSPSAGIKTSRTACAT